MTRRPLAPVWHLALAGLACTASAIAVVGFLVWGLRPTLHGLVGLAERLAGPDLHATRQVAELAANGGIALVGLALVAILAASALRR